MAAKRWRGGSPGASGPGDPGYEGEVTIGDEGAVAGPESFVDPNAGPDEHEEGDEGDQDGPAAAPVPPVG